MAWKPPYAITADLAGWLRIDDDPSLAMPIEAASRAVDRECGRQFGSATQTREYEATWHRDRWHIVIDDLQTATTVETIHEDGTVIQTITDYVLTPRNAAPDGRPYTGLEMRSFSGGSWWPYGWHCEYPMKRLVRVTGEFGWAAIPDAIKQATLIQAGRFLERRTSTLPLQSQQVDDIRYQWGSGRELDPDIAASVGPYVRRWGAV